MLVVRVLLTIFTRGTSLSDIILSVLFMAGIWRIFEKSGIKAGGRCSPARGNTNWRAAPGVNLKGPYTPWPQPAASRCR